MDRTLLGRLLGTVGTSHDRLGNAQKAVGYHKQRLVIVRDIEDPRGEAAALGNLGIAYVTLGEVQKGSGFHDQALEIVRKIGDRQCEGNFLGSLGNVYRNLGEVQKATSLLQQSKAIGEQIGDPQIVQKAALALTRSLTSRASRWDRSHRRLCRSNYHQWNAAKTQEPKTFWCFFRQVLLSHSPSSPETGQTWNPI